MINFSKLARPPSALEQHLTDAPKDAGPAGEPAGDIERRRHRHGAGHVDPTVSRADAIETTEGSRHSNRASRVAAKGEIARAGCRSPGPAPRGAPRQSARG